MIGIDTNVLVRFIVQDDPRQAELANAWFNTLTREKPGFVALVTLAELAWTLRAAYDFEHGRILDVMEALLGSDELEFEDAETALRAVEVARGGGDFADALIKDTADLWGCDEVVTFDPRAAREVGMRLLG